MCSAVCHRECLDVLLTMAGGHRECLDVSLTMAGECLDVSLTMAGALEGVSGCVPDYGGCVTGSF